MLNHFTPKEIADNMNKRVLRSGNGKLFDSSRINTLKRAYGLKPRFDRLRESGYLTSNELAERFGVDLATVRSCHAKGRLVGHLANDTGQHLFEDPGSILPPQNTYAVGSTKEVQYD